MSFFFNDWQMIQSFNQTQSNKLNMIIDDMIFIKIDIAFTQHVNETKIEKMIELKIMKIKINVNMKTNHDVVIIMLNFFVNRFIVEVAQHNIISSFTQIMKRSQINESRQSFLFKRQSTFDFFQHRIKFTSTFSSSLRFDESINRDSKRLRSQLLFFNTFFSSISLIKQLRVENMNYFDSETQTKKKKKKNFWAFVINVSKHVYYINVYIFVDKLKNLTKSHDMNSMINVIIACLRDHALIWHFEILNEWQKNKLRINDLKLWYITLIDKFKIKTIEILNLLIVNRYDLSFVRNIKSRVWIMQMRCFARVVAFNSIFNQLIIMWNQLNVQLRRDISMLDLNIIITFFLNQLNEKISIWEKMIDPQQRQQLQHRQSQYQHFFNKNVHFNNDIKSSLSSRVAIDKNKIYIMEETQKNENENFADYCDYENEYSVN